MEGEVKNSLVILKQVAAAYVGDLKTHENIQRAVSVIEKALEKKPDTIDSHQE